MTARTKARKRALDVLYAADLRGVDSREVLAELVAERVAARDSINPYTVELVEGVHEHLERIDELLLTHAEGWALDRMPFVDRNLLRIGVFEILWQADVPDAVVASEAVELSTQISTDDSPRFINGLLSRVIDLKPMLPEGREAILAQTPAGEIPPSE